MKKTISLSLLLLCLLAASACQSPEKRVRTVADGFLKAYYTGDYGTASGYCTPGFAGQVGKGALAMQAVPDEIAEKMKEAVSQTSFKIISVEVDRDAAKAAVRYDLSVPALDKPVPKILRLQLEGRTAAVDGIE